MAELRTLVGKVAGNTAEIDVLLKDGRLIIIFEKDLRETSMKFYTYEDIFINSEKPGDEFDCFFAIFNKI